MTPIPTPAAKKEEMIKKHILELQIKFVAITIRKPLLEE